jgi:dihydroorotase
MFGSDSAPHPKHAKEACGCAAGVFTAPIALQVLTELFETNSAPLENLQAFISGNAQNIYGVTPIAKKVTLEKKDFTVPADYNGVVPMYAGELLAYSIKDITNG